MMQCCLQRQQKHYRFEVKRYSERMYLTVNTEQTKIMVFEKIGCTNTNLYFGSKKLEVVKSFKYLGLEFYKNGNWARSQKRLADHTAFALHILYVVLDKVEMKVSDMVQLFNSFARSILLYAAESVGVS
jgi:hypothetical protein